MSDSATPWTTTRQASLSFTIPEFAQVYVHWVSDAIQPSHPLLPFSSCLPSFLESGSFLMSQLFTSGSQSTGASVLASVLPMNTQDWFPLGLTGLISLLSKGFSRVFSSTIIQKHQVFGAQPSLGSNPHIYTWLLDEDKVKLPLPPTLPQIRVYWRRQSQDDYWKNHSFDYTDLGRQSDVSAF